MEIEIRNCQVNDVSINENYINAEQFWHAIQILISNYHAVNKKIFACVLSDVRKVSNGIANLEQQSGESTATDLTKCTEDELQASLMAKVKDCEGYKINLQLLTKKFEHNIEAVGIVDFINCMYICKFDCENLDDFMVKHENQQIFLTILTNRVDVERTKRWSEYVLKPKLLNWSQSDVGTNSKVIKSLQLIDVERYNNFYKYLKKTYAQHLLKLWQEATESTDPLKFIYEDLAIAAYLISLWQKTNSYPKAFADLGCGNGLLVYILNAEGYNGYGYDIRERKLWSYYAATKAKLFEATIEPDTFKLPPEVDWLIGNHSDELSPWLPAIAATASYDMRYFLLPCCAYEFSGIKFQRRNTGISSYQDFLQYAIKISEHCGFNTLEDRLKIPSTKRIALVGIDRTHDKSTYGSQCSVLTKFIAEERLKYSFDSLDSDAIKLREKVETVRNCTQLDKTFVDALVLKIFRLLLDSENFQTAKKSASAASWLSGKPLSMREIAASLTKDELKQIKTECGGIKTVLRNKHEVFVFCGNDLFGIRKPQTRSPLNGAKLQFIKKRLCFFKQNHPQGCPLTDDDCTFIH